MPIHRSQNRHRPPGFAPCRGLRRDTVCRQRDPDITDRGFTLMEVIVVLLVIGIITAFAVGRGSSEGVKLKVRNEVFKTHLRHAQLRAVSAGDYWGIATNDTGTQYWLFHHDGSTTTQIPLPGEDETTVDLSGEGSQVTPGIYSFDERGIPYFANASDTPPGSVLTSGQNVTVKKGAVSANFQITQHTGFIE